jgi:hypothetical protein
MRDAFFCGKTRDVFGVEVYRKSTGVLELRKSEGKATAPHVLTLEALVRACAQCHSSPLCPRRPEKPAIAIDTNTQPIAISK